MQKRTFHYGWIVTIACGIMLFSSIGLTVNSFAVFLTPLIDTVGLTKTQGSTVSGFQSLGGILAMLCCGALFNRFGARKVSFAAGLCISFGFVAFAYSRSMWSSCVASFLTGIGYGAGSMIPVSILLTAWFDDKRGLALGLATAGSGIGTIIFPPFLAGVIARDGITAGFLCLAATIALLTLITFLMVRDLPSDKGLEPYGGGHGTAENRPSRDGTNFTLAQAMRTKEFRLTVFVLVLLGGNVQPCLHHFSTFYTSEGYAPSFGAMMMSLYGIVMLASKPLYGWIIDRFGILKSNTYVLAAWLLAMVAGLFIGDNIAFAYMFTVLLGIGVPVGTMGLPIWCSALFGKANMAGIFSSFKLFYALGGFLGMVLPGYMADNTGRYVHVFYILIAATVLAYAVIQYVFLAKNAK